MKKTLLCIATIVMSLILAGCPEEVTGNKALCIRNNSNQEMYFWYSKEYFHYHYPDTELPVYLPINYQIRGTGIGGCVGSMEWQRPNWETIFSQLPEDKFSVYFFETYPETQEDWDDLRNNMEELVYRKDVTFEELKANDYVIEYP